MEAGAESGRTVGGVARGLQALSSQRGGTLVMRLDPGNLGQIRMEMSLDAGRVQVVIAAAGDAARGLLRENLGVLRNALEDRGFAVERLTVESAARTTADSSGTRGESRGDGQDARGGQESSDRQDASDERSRGRRDDATHRRSERGGSESDRFQEVLAGSGETSNA
jgi:flagellar hook-length control protein FliK